MIREASVSLEFDESDCRFGKGLQPLAMPPARRGSAESQMNLSATRRWPPNVLSGIPCDTTSSRVALRSPLTGRFETVFVDGSPKL
jgi:hypothetical protein